MKSAGLIALALTGILVAVVSEAAPRRGPVPNNLYVREGQGGIPDAVMQQNGQWAQLPPDAYYGGGPQGGPQGYPQGSMDPGYGYGYGQPGGPGGPAGPGGPVGPGGPEMEEGYYGGQPPMTPDMGVPPVGGPPVGVPPVGGMPPVAGVPPAGMPPVGRGGCGGRIVVYGGVRYCGGAIIQEEGFEEEKIYRYREYNRVQTAPVVSPFGHPY